jgi:hypothetical protein
MNSTTTSYKEEYVSASHLSAYFRDLHKLKREEAIASLLELIDATEEDSLFTGCGVISAYYEQLAIMYRKRKEYTKEIAILARYARQRHSYADARREILEERLERARKLFTRKTSSD